MATKPDFLNDSAVPFRYLQSTGITDVNTIISDVRSELVTNSTWTEPSTALFKSPPDSAGKFFDILLTKIAATNLEIRLRDYRGATLYTRRIQIDATASVNYFTNTRGICIESLRATSEVASAYLLETTPDLLADVDNRLVGTTLRSTADTVDGAGGTMTVFFAFDAGAATNGNRCWACSNDAAGLVTMINGSATLVYRPHWVAINQSGTRRYTGRPYHALVGDAASLTFGTDKTIPLGDGTTGTFRVIGLTTTNNKRLLLRKA